MCGPAVERDCVINVLKFVWEYAALLCKYFEVTVKNTWLEVNFLINTVQIQKFKIAFLWISLYDVAILNEINKNSQGFI